MLRNRRSSACRRCGCREVMGSRLGFPVFSAWDATEVELVERERTADRQQRDLFVISRHVTASLLW